jgi:hypothetical protein
MSQENVESVRGYTADVDQALKTRWNDSEVPFNQSAVAVALSLSLPGSTSSVGP